MYLKDPSTKEPSPTLTIMMVGVGVAFAKLMLAGSTVLGISFGQFSGTDFAGVVTPLLALYGHKRMVKPSDSTEPQDGSEAQQ